jgi:hypothetical protein
VGSPIQIISKNTSSIDAAFYKYMVSSGSNSRAGMVIANWTSGSVNYTDTSNLGIGSTDTVTMSVDLSGNNVRLLTTIGIGINWKIKVQVDYL